MFKIAVIFLCSVFCFVFIWRSSSVQSELLVISKRAHQIQETIKNELGKNSIKMTLKAQWTDSKGISRSVETVQLKDESFSDLQTRHDDAVKSQLVLYPK